MSIIGIDPGAKGGVAVLDGDDLRICPMCSSLDLWLLVKTWMGSTVKHVYIEKAQAMPRQGVTSMFTYGKSVGKLIGVIEAAQVPYTEVAPQAWKKVVLAGMDRSDKSSSIKRAKQLFPHIDFRATERCRKDSDGMAEAALIAWYGMNLAKGG